jgi:small subunit ribosomal protein S9
MARKLVKKQKKVQKVIKKVQPKKVGSTAKASQATSQAQVALPTGKYIEGIGRRKVATARVRIYEDSTGEFIVNGQAAGKYFSSVINASMLYTRPLEAVGLKGKFTVSAMVKGSGPRAQLGAVVHGLSRALIKKDPELRAILKPTGMLTRDDRMKETRKIGMGGKARRKRQSPRR